MLFLSHPRFRWLILATLALTLAFSIALRSTVTAATPGVATLQLSSDPYTNTTSQHQTEVEPDSYSNGATIVAATQVGRFNDGGASNIGWATSTDNGATWQNGFLPGTTVFATPAGQFDRVSDPSVSYDAAHKLWMISSLAISSGSGTAVGAAVIVNTSSNGGLTWNPPVVVANANGGFFDKDWLVCDDTSTSAYYGHCYVEWDINSGGSLVQMSTSSDGGATWSAGQATQDNVSGLGGQPLVQPNGTVIVPFLSSNSSIAAFTSTNGGVSWNSSVTIASQTDHQVAGIRTEPLPSAEIDGAGKAYVAWQDCRFENGCSANDIVISTSTDGATWSAETTLTSSAMDLAWLAATTSGNMVGDYISTSFANGKAFPVFVVASAPGSGGQLNEALFTTKDGLAIAGGTLSAAGEHGNVVHPASPMLRTAF